MRVHKRRLLAATPLVLSAALVMSSCGGGSDDAANSAQQDPAAVTDTAGAPTDALGTDAAANPDAAPVEGAVPDAAAGAEKAPVGGAATDAKTGTSTKTKTDKNTTGGTAKGSLGGLTSIDTAAAKTENEKIAASKSGATDMGVTKDSIKMGTVGMYGMALGNLLIGPIAAGVKATFTSINDRGGVLGRRMSLIECDDGPGEVSRSKACIKKLSRSGQDLRVPRLHELGVGVDPLRPRPVQGAGHRDLGVLADRVAGPVHVPDPHVDDPRGDGRGDTGSRTSSSPRPTACSA